MRMLYKINSPMLWNIAYFSRCSVLSVCSRNAVLSAVCWCLMAPRYSFLLSFYSSSSPSSPPSPMGHRLILVIFGRGGWFEGWPPAAKSSPLPALHQITLGLGILRSPHSLSFPFSLTLRHVQSTLLIDQTMCSSRTEINLCWWQKCHRNKKCQLGYFKFGGRCPYSIFILFYY